MKQNQVHYRGGQGIYYPPNKNAARNMPKGNLSLIKGSKKLQMNLNATRENELGIV
jgi:hypothetical protein